jgi:precorrin-6Y C5,15-methyltransferase (decarboxylating)
MSTAVDRRGAPAGRASELERLRPEARIVVVGIGEDGWEGLGGRARDALRGARLVLGAPRQLALLPAAEVPEERCEAWPSPMRPRVEALAASMERGDTAAGTVVLASGDPMLHGIGAVLAELVGPERLKVLPAPSAFSLACGRLGWPAHAVPLVSLVADPGAEVIRALSGGRAIVYVPGAGGAAMLAARLRDAGLAAARLTILERLGGPAERRIDALAADVDADYDPLHLVAVECPPAGGDGRLASRVPGLPDATYASDGQLTRAEVRAVALAALAPCDGELLWDIGAGTGTIAIEWCRAAPGAHAIAIERRADRAATVAENAEALGAAGRVRVIEDGVPAALDGLPQPHAIFVGGATSQPGLIERCWAALRPGGRLVAAAVTLESEQALLRAHEQFGGRLIRLEHSHLDRLGRFTAWRPERPIVQWAATKPSAPSAERQSVVPLGATDRRSPAPQPEHHPQEDSDAR